MYIYLCLYFCISFVANIFVILKHQKQYKNYSTIGPSVGFQFFHVWLDNFLLTHPFKPGSFRRKSA